MSTRSGTKAGQVQYGLAWNGATPAPSGPLLLNVRGADACLRQGGGSMGEILGAGIKF